MLFAEKLLVCFRPYLDRTLRRRVMLMKLKNYTNDGWYEYESVFYTSLTKLQLCTNSALLPSFELYKVR